MLPLAIVVVVPLADLLCPFLTFLEPDKVRTRTVVGREGDKTVLELDGGGYLIVWTNYPNPGGSSALKISRRRRQTVNAWGLGREHLTNSLLRHWSCSSLWAFSSRPLQYCSLFCCDQRTVEKTVFSFLFVRSPEGESRRDSKLKS